MAHQFTVCGLDLVASHIEVDADGQAIRVTVDDDANAKLIQLRQAMRVLPVGSIEARAIGWKVSPMATPVSAGCRCDGDVTSWTWTLHGVLSREA